MVKPSSDKDLVDKVLNWYKDRNEGHTLVRISNGKWLAKYGTDVNPDDDLKYLLEYNGLYYMVSGRQ